MYNPRCTRCEPLKCSKCGTRKKINPFVWRGKVGLLCHKCAETLEKALTDNIDRRFQPLEIVQHHCDNDLAQASVGLEFFREHNVRFIDKNISINDAFELEDEK